MRREHLLNYFSTFGNVQNVRIHKKSTHSFGFVTFTRAESAAKALAKPVHKIAGREISVVMADSWHQEKPLELCNNFEDAATSSSSTRDVKLPIELTNATGTYLLNLNDDCLYAIFSLKFVNIMDLCSVAESCTRLKQIANRIFAGTHKICNFNGMSLKTIHEMRRFLLNFGSSITELTIEESNEFEKMSARILDLVIRYCCKTLQSLTLKKYEITVYLTSKLRPMFNNLQKLCIEGGSIEGAGKHLFSNCGSLVELKVINLENETEDFGIIFENRFPKLERFKYEKKYDDYGDYNLEEFVSRHKRLKTFSMKHFEDDCTSLLPVIAENCKDLENLRIVGTGHANPANYEEALKSLLALGKLKKLKIKCADANITKFIQELTKLSSLEFLELWYANCDAELIPALAQLKTVNVLRLRYCHQLKNLNALADLKHLNELSIVLHPETNEIQFDLVQMIKRLTNLKKLTLEMDATGVTFTIDKRMYLKIVDAVRGRSGRSSPFLEIKTGNVADDVVESQFDGSNNCIVKLEKFIDNLSDDDSYTSDSDQSYYSDSDFDPFFYDDDDVDDDHLIHPAFLMPLFNQIWFGIQGNRGGNNENSDEDDDEENEVW